MGSGRPSVLLVDDEPRLRAQLHAVLDDYVDGTIITTTLGNPEP